MKKYSIVFSFSSNENIQGEENKKKCSLKVDAVDLSAATAIAEQYKNKVEDCSGYSIKEVQK